MHDGVTVRLGDADFIVPALTFKQLRSLLPKFARLQDAPAGFDAGQLDAITEIAQAALGRNYPDLRIEDLEERLTFADVPALIAAVMTGSGLAQARLPAESAAAGE